jgi:hypothetical protein
VTPPPEAGPGQRKTGCLLAFGASGVLALVLFGVVVWLALGMWKSFDAPGRDVVVAAGCDEAQVADLRGMPGGEGTKDKPMQAVVVCLMRLGKEGPPCEDVARAYGKMPNAAARFVVTKTILGDRSEQAKCSGIFDPQGTYLGPAPTH